MSEFAQACALKLTLCTRNFRNHSLPDSIQDGAANNLFGSDDDEEEGDGDHGDDEEDAIATAESTAEPLFDASDADGDDDNQDVQLSAQSNPPTPPTQNASSEEATAAASASAGNTSKSSETTTTPIESGELSDPQSNAPNANTNDNTSAAPTNEIVEENAPDASTNEATPATAATTNDASPAESETNLEEEYIDVSPDCQVTRVSALVSLGSMLLPKHVRSCTPMTTANAKRYRNEHCVLLQLFVDIHKDVVRTHPGLSFFNNTKGKCIMSLVIVCRCDACSWRGSPKHFYAAFWLE